jgi:simple sugar transport system permease protein
MRKFARPLAGPLGRSEWRRRAFDLLASVGMYLTAIVVALALGGFIVSITGGSVGETIEAMLDGAIRRQGSLGETIDQATPIMIVALGTTVAFRAGLINLGQEGQLLIGATLATAVAVKISGPPGWFMVVLALVASVVGGGMWAAIPAVLRSWRRVSEVLSTLLLVFVAMQITSLAVSREYLLRQHAPLGPSDEELNRNIVSDRVPDSVHLGSIELFANRFNIGIVFALVAAVALTVLLFHTDWGFKLRMLGLNPAVAHRAGVRSGRTGGWALMISGALAGLAGGVMLVGRDFQLTPGFSNNVGWEGLLVALVARNRPGVVVVVALFFGMLRSGGGFLAATGVERVIVNVVQGLLVVALLLPPLYADVRRGRRRELAGART